ncbi:hypothetical protein GCM10027049_15610 [Mucilaginibacter puniceus]
MKKCFVFITILGMAFYSCKSFKGPEEKEEDLKSELSGKVMHYLKSVNTDSTIIIDSVKIYDLDTLTQKADSLDMILSLYTKFDELKLEIEPIGEQIKSDTQLMRLANGLSSELYSNYKDEFDKHMSQYKSINEKMKSVISRIEKLESLTQGKTLDSLKATGFAAKFNIKAHNLSGVSEDRDSLQIEFDLDKRIRKNKM